MQSNPLPEPLVIRMLRADRAALLAREDLQLQRMARQWHQIEISLQDEMLLLAQQIAEAKESGAIITEQLIGRMDRYKRLNTSLKTQVLNYSKTKAAADISTEQLAYAKVGIDGAVAAIKVQYDMGVVFNTLSVDQFNDLSGMLGDGTPLNRLLKEAYPDSLDGIIKGLLEGTARGLSPVATANLMAKGMGLGLDRITLIARTEQLRAWRTSTAEQYRSSGVVLYSKRLSAKDTRTCMACLMADGDIVPLDEVLSDHPRGRCTTVPVVKGAPEITWEGGKQWFDRQDPSVQKDMMGPGMYDLWQKQGFDPKKLSGVAYNPIWGKSPRVKTLAEMKGISRIAFAKSEQAHKNFLTDKIESLPKVPLKDVFSGNTELWTSKGRQEFTKELEDNISRLVRIQDPRAVKDLRDIYIVTDKQKWLDQWSQGGRIEIPSDVLNGKAKIAGFYKFERKSLWIFSEDGKTVDPFTFTHELGHHAQNISRHPEYWNNIYNGDKTFDRHTAYAATQDIEGFAETFAAWTAEGKTDEWDSFSVLMEVLDEIP